jgi:hypothetical protein
MTEYIQGVSIHQLMLLNENKLVLLKTKCISPASYLQIPLNILTIYPDNTLFNVEIVEKEGTMIFETIHSIYNNSFSKFIKYYPSIKIKDHSGDTLKIDDKEISKCIQSYFQ